MPPSSSPPKPTLSVGTPACCRNGVKSDPEPNAPMRRSLRVRASLFPPTMRAARARAPTGAFVSGSMMSRATSLAKRSSEWEPSTPNMPRPLPSVFR